MKVIILAAGKGSRLGKFIEEKPKCLLKLGTESILEREIRILKEVGFEESDIYVVGGYKAEYLEGIAPNLIFNPQWNIKDNSYSLGLALKSITDDDVMIMDADLCFETSVIMELLKDPRENVLLSKKSNDENESTGIVTTENGEVVAIGKQYHNTGYVYISIFKIGVNTKEQFTRALLTETSEKTWYPLAITQILSKHPFYNHVTCAKWHEIDFEEDYWATLKLFHLRRPTK